jgi:riboflavin synthase
MKLYNRFQRKGELILMFTGLVEEVGKIQTVTKFAKSSRIAIRASKILEDVKIGDSISTNGVCLTVTELGTDFFTADVMAETMRRSNLKNLISGAPVNLERALRLGDRLGGHMVSGHIDGTGIITEFQEEDNAVWITIKTSEALLRYIVEKGSIAMDGVSLTVAYVDKYIFKVSIIPHTKTATTLLQKKTGDEINLECDAMGKYIEKLLAPKEEASVKENIDIDFLEKHGFL